MRRVKKKQGQKVILDCIYRIKNEEFRQGSYGSDRLNKLNLGLDVPPMVIFKNRLPSVELSKVSANVKDFYVHDK